MATKTFSGRADAEKLARADAVTQREFGLSYGQYCATVLLDIVAEGGALPEAHADDERRARRVAAIRSMRERASRFANPEIARMSDEEIKELIASRYE